MIKRITILLLLCTVFISACGSKDDETYSTIEGGKDTDSNNNQSPRESYQIEEIKGNGTFTVDFSETIEKAKEDIAESSKKVRIEEAKMDEFVVNLKDNLDDVEDIYNWDEEKIEETISKKNEVITSIKRGFSATGMRPNIDDNSGKITLDSSFLFVFFSAEL